MIPKSRHWLIVQHQAIWALGSHSLQEAPMTTMRDFPAVGLPHSNGRYPRFATSAKIASRENRTLAPAQRRQAPEVPRCVPARSCFVLLVKFQVVFSQFGLVFLAFERYYPYGLFSQIKLRTEGWRGLTRRIRTDFDRPPVLSRCRFRLGFSCGLMSWLVAGHQTKLGEFCLKPFRLRSEI